MKRILTSILMVAIVAFASVIMGLGMDKCAVAKGKKLPAKGKVVAVGGVKYKITKSAAKNGTVAVTGVKNKNVRTVTIPASVKVCGYRFQVTSVRSNAFSGCRKLCRVNMRCTGARCTGTNGCGRNFVDANGDGVCDHHGTRNGHGYGTRGHGHGAGGHGHGAGGHGCHGTR